MDTIIHLSTLSTEKAFRHLVISGILLSLFERHYKTEHLQTRIGVGLEIYDILQQLLEEGVIQVHQGEPSLWVLSTEVRRMMVARFRRP